MFNTLKRLYDTWFTPEMVIGFVLGLILGVQIFW
jgi:hypothetical protein